MDEASATWFLYVLRCADDSLYTGISPDVTQRLRLHESGRGARYVRGRGPLEVVCTLPMGSRGDALRAERRFKRVPKARKESLLSDRQSLVEFLGVAASDCG